MLTKRDLLFSVAITTLAVATAKSTPALAQNKADWPDLLTAKNIAEEGFIYGLPLVMNYAVMQEFAVDRNSGQFKATFNEINNMHHVATPADTAIITPNSDTPYSFIWLDLRAEPMVISVPMIERDRYYSVQLIDANTYNFGYIGTRATGTEQGDYLVVGPDWKGEKPTGIKQVFRSTTPFTFTAIRTQLFHPDDMPNVEKIQAGYKAQPLSAFLKQAAPPAAPKIAFLPASTAGIKDNFFPVSRRRAAIRPGDLTGQGHPGQTCQDRHRPRQDLRFQGFVARAQSRNSRGHEAGRREGRQMAGGRKQGHQRLERRLVLWR